MIMNIGRNEKGKLVCWVPTIKRGVERLDGILVSDLVLTIPQSPLPTSSRSSARSVPHLSCAAR